MSKALEDYSDETGLQPYVKKQPRKHDMKSWLDRVYNFLNEWGCDCAYGTCITFGGGGIAWRTVEAIGSKLGYSNNYSFFNTTHFDTLGPMFLFLGLFFHDAHRYELENTQRLLGNITKYFKNES